MTETGEIKDDSIQKQIIQAARQLFQVHGLHKVTMDDVAREIGKRRSSLYYYYKSKEEILDAAIDFEMKEILAEISRAVDKASGLQEKLRAYCLTRLKISQKRREFYNMVDGLNAGELSEYKKVRATIYNRFRQMETPVIRRILQGGAEKGLLREMAAKEQDTLIAVVLNSLQGFKKEMLLKKSFNSIEPVVDMLIHLVIQGFKK